MPNEDRNLLQANHTDCGRNATPGQMHRFSTLGRFCPR